MPGIPLLDLALLGLLGTAALVSLIELGLSAWAVDSTNGFYNFRTPAEFAFVLFVSLWTLIGVGVFLVLEFLGNRRGGVSRPFAWLGWATLIYNFVTWVFWLAGFAAVAALYVVPPREAAGALLAFAVILWLIFTALLVLNGLTAFTILRSDRLGYRPLFSRNGKVSRPLDGPSMTTA